MRYFIIFSYLLAAAINLIPVVGVLSNEILSQLYAIQIDRAEFSLLLRHRAVLFGIVGGLLLTAAFMPRLRTQAGIAGLLSMLSFILLFMLIGTDNDSLLRVTLIDAVVALVFIVGFSLHLFSTHENARVKNVK